MHCGQGYSFQLSSKYDGALDAEANSGMSSEDHCKKNALAVDKVRLSGGDNFGGISFHFPSFPVLYGLLTYVINVSGLFCTWEICLNIAHLAVACK